MTQTGPRTKFGHTAAPVQTAHVVSAQQTTVLKIVRNLAIFNGVIYVPIPCSSCGDKNPLISTVAGLQSRELPSSQTVKAACPPGSTLAIGRPADSVTSAQREESVPQGDREAGEAICAPRPLEC